MCSLPLLRSSKKQIAVVLVFGVVPQFTRQGKANRMAFMVSLWTRIRVNEGNSDQGKRNLVPELAGNSSYPSKRGWKVGSNPREMGLSSSHPKIRVKPGS